MSDKSDGTTGYDLESVSMPVMSGFVLKLLTSLVESPFNGLIQPSLLDKAGISQFRKRLFDDLPTFIPLYEPDGNITGQPATPDDVAIPKGETSTETFRFNTIADYAARYRDGSLTPLDVAERFIQAAAESDNRDKPLRAFVTINREDIMKQAEASTERLKKGEPLGILDGVPISVKDQFTMKNYPTSTGTSFMAGSAAKEDCFAAAALRKTGAVLTGKTNMHELGLGVTGHNAHHGTTRNPYNPDHHSGGSSSGSAVAVAAGLGPASVGADGGGSIRIPSSFCGLTGLKPTFGRVSLSGDSQLCWSVEHVGPLAATATDAAIIYAAISGIDPKDPYTFNQPPIDLTNWDTMDISGLRIGIYPQYFRHANSETVAVCESLLKKFEDLGAVVKEITIHDLEASRVAHTITIAAEISQSLEKYYARRHREFSLDIRLNLAMARKFTAHDFLLAQRVRTRMIEDHKRILKEVDVIFSPTTAIPAPPIQEKTLPAGQSDLSTLFEIMRYAPVSNMTGLPSISFPAGYTRNGLPVGMHVTAKPWNEKILLRLAYAAESLIERKSPQVYYDLLKD